MKMIRLQSSGVAAVTALLLLPPANIGGPAPDVLRYATVKQDVVNARLKEYGGDNQQREATLKRLFQESGCDEPHLSEQAVKGSKQPNVICVLPGKTDRRLIVGAHFDRVSQGDGVVDNWSGASLLPSLYQSVKAVEREHTYIFVGFTEEEEGEIGSRSYVHQMSKEDIAATDAMVNMDTLGLGPTQVWESHSDKRLSGAIAYLAKRLELPASGVNVEQVGSSDSEQFAEKKIPRITVHSLTQKSWDQHILHTSKDKLTEIKLDDYYQTYRLVAAYLVFLDQLPARHSTIEKGH
jgi:putative aminopeptidase FrvX